MGQFLLKDLNDQQKEKLYYLPCFFVFFLSLLVYVKTLLPTVGFWDVGEAQTVPYTLDVAHPTGFPTYIILGKIFTLIFPFGSIAWRLNFFSAILASSSVVFLYLSSFLLTKNRFFSTFAALNFAFGKFVWQNAIRADVHNLHIFLTSFIVYLLLLTYKTKKFFYFYFLSFLVGLSLGNHLLSIFCLPAIFFLFLFLRNKKDIFLKTFYCLTFFLLGASVYIILPIIASVKPPLTTDYSLATWQGFLRHVAAGDFQGLMGHWTKGDFFHSLAFYFQIFLRQSHFFSFIFVFIGFLTMLKRKLIQFIFLLTIFFSTSFFSLNYANAIIERYFLTPFLIASLFLAYGFTVIKAIKRLPLFFSIILIFLASFFPLSNLIKNYKVVDQSKNYGALSFAENAFFSAKQDSVIISWWSFSTPLWYLQKVEGEREDIQIINAGGNQWEGVVLKNIGKKNVYLIEPFDFKNPILKLRKEGILYRVILVNNKLAPF